MKKTTKQVKNAYFLEFLKICKNLGIINFEDLKLFIYENVPKNGNIFECLKNYYNDLKSLTSQEKFYN